MCIETLLTVSVSVGDASVSGSSVIVDLISSLPSCSIASKSVQLGMLGAVVHLFLQDIGCIHKDETGAFLVDRDPAYFSTILNFLRHGKLILNEQLTEEGVLAEAEYYNISSLVSLVKERIRQRAAAQSRHSVKHVYRVLQCREEELTQMVSTMSDGWKFEQLVAIGSAYGYSGSHQAEYLLIVSREVKTEDDGPAHVPCEVTSREVCHETESEGLLPATRGAASNGLLPEPTDKAKMLLERGSRRV
uniref:Potassium channel tetramerization domain containing 2 n=1 Tax=Eptatretus burgeri TaxID=7764 RepID=A0A8C4NJI0_EPTBU